MDTEALDREREYWLRRLEATGRAQGRYLWVLFLAGIFYAALRVGPVENQFINVPIVDLRLDRLTVLASGAPVMAFLVLVVMGAIRAWTRAAEQVRGEAPAKDVEPLDTYPNAIDLAMYTTSDSPKSVRKLLSFAYPLFLTSALIEVAWLALPVVSGPERVVGAWGYLAGVLVLAVPALVLVGTMWKHRITPPR